MTPAGRPVAVRSSSLILLFLFAALMAAQDYRGRIQGNIRDTSGAVIPGAAVTLRNVNTGITVVRDTNSTGQYVFDLVEPGFYSVSVEARGFTKFVQANVPLAARGDVTVDAALKAGDVRETITVSAEASQVQFTTEQPGDDRRGQALRRTPATVSQPIRARHAGPFGAQRRYQLRIQSVQ